VHRVFIGVRTCTCMNICICIVFLKKSQLLSPHEDIQLERLPHLNSALHRSAARSPTTATPQSSSATVDASAPRATGAVVPCVRQGHHRVMLTSSRRPWRRPETAFFFLVAQAQVPAISGYPPEQLFLPRASPKLHATP
jgi:hypothetical protein